MSEESSPGVIDALLNSNEDYERVTRAIDTLNRQLEQARADIVTLKLAKQHGLADPISLAEKLRDGTLEQTPNWQRIHRTPSIDWSRYPRRPSLRIGGDTTRYHPYRSNSETKPSLTSPTSPTSSTSHSSMDAISSIITSPDAPPEDPSDLMAFVLKVGASVGLYPKRKQSKSESEGYNGDGGRRWSSGYSEAPARGKGIGKSMELLFPSENENKRVTNEPSTVKNDVEEIKSEDVAMETSSAAANARVYSGTFSESGNMTADNDFSKPANHNVPWTDEEQRRLVELLRIYPDEEIQSHRFKRISMALGTRTPKQVASRIQKYFIKLAKHGLPVPGRMPNLNFSASSSMMKNKSPDVVSKSKFKPTRQPDSRPRRPRVSGVAYMDSQTPPTILMNENDDDVIEVMLTIVDATQKSIANKGIKNGNNDVAVNNVIHYGFCCDSCQVDPIVGPRYQCVDCMEKDQEIDLCEVCMETGDFEIDGHQKTHHFALRTTPEPTQSRENSI
ncbi:2274_t:CDS:10 [Paraglomus brasilianum]|uniref:2274_t:CDS:1 n=1 Tax=Paraglomus brasilianum TaxID=144538 RepID=A0A9N8W9E0_9GLOM|nr:2274_t:CDS:10 [Paraglomus brasilianum]